MKTHELTLDIDYFDYFDDIKSGKYNFEIRKNNHDFKIGDILQLKIYPHKENICDVDIADEANMVKALIIGIADSEFINKAEETINGIPQSIKWPNDIFSETYISSVRRVLKQYFYTDKLPDDYVVIGIKRMR